MVGRASSAVFCRQWGRPPWLVLGEAGAAAWPTVVAQTLGQGLGAAAGAQCGKWACRRGGVSTPWEPQGSPNLQSPWVELTAPRSQTQHSPPHPRSSAGAPHATLSQERLCGACSVGRKELTGRRGSGGAWAPCGDRLLLATLLFLGRNSFYYKSAPSPWRMLAPLPPRWGRLSGRTDGAAAPAQRRRRRALRKAARNSALKAV